MESLDKTSWDVVISGTGFSQSLLALALSRSGKKVLHLDKNGYYGGQEAALSLDEAEAWAQNVQRNHSSFTPAAIERTCTETHQHSQLGFSRAYSLSLSPQIIYNRSTLLPTLVSSKVYQQLEFLAVGSWWIYDPSVEEKHDCDGHIETENSIKCLHKIPSSREDVVNDDSIDLRSKRNVMRFLQLAANVDAYRAAIEESGSLSFTDFLSTRFKLPDKLQAPFHALTLSLEPPSTTTTAYALPRIHRHLTSIGQFGPGFGAVIPKWGGLAEVAQVACRAGAVGGGVYVLDKGVVAVKEVKEAKSNEENCVAQIELSSEEIIEFRKLVGSRCDLPIQDEERDSMAPQVWKGISIISSPLDRLFPSPAEGAPPSAAALVILPSHTLASDNGSISSSDHPVYLMIHSSDTGECPSGQCVIYSQCAAASSSPSTLRTAVTKLLSCMEDEPDARVLWHMQYTQDFDSRPCHSTIDGVSHLPDLPRSLALEDDVLQSVKEVWKEIVGEQTSEGFMVFKEREDLTPEDDTGVDDGD